MKDELNDRRHQKMAVDASAEMIHAMSAQSTVQDFSEWLLANMPAVALSTHANSLMGGILGTSIGTWFDAGADDKLVKEYLCRFTDVLWAQYRAAMREIERER